MLPFLAALVLVDAVRASDPAAEVAAALAGTNQASSFRYVATIRLSEALSVEVGGGVVAPDRISLRADLPGFGGVLPPSTVEAVVVGETAYVRQTAVLPDAAPGGWVRLEPGNAGSAAAGVPGLINAGAVQRYLGQTRTLEVLVAAGAAVTGGEPREEADEPLMSYVVEGPDGGAWQVAVGEASGFVRRLEWRQDGTSLSLSFFDYDAALEIEPPM